MEQFFRIVKAYKKILSYDFSSVQFDLPSDISSEIIEWGKKNIPDNVLYSEPGDPALFTGRELESHVTVKYGLHINDPVLVQGILKDIQPFEIKLGTIDIFDKPECDVVKINIESPELIKLNKLISDSFDVTDTFPIYKPHATIGYLKKGKGKKYIGDKTFMGKKVKVNAVTFSSRDNRKVTLNLKKAALTPRPERLLKFPPIIAIDFDTTIVEEMEDIMDPNFTFMKDAKEVLDWMYAKGFYIIIWTVRTGECLKIAMDFLLKNNVHFDKVNENAGFLNFPTSRKIYFDFAIDDRSVFEPIQWLKVKDFLQKNFL